MVDEEFQDLGEGGGGGKKGGLPTIVIFIIIAVVMGAVGFFGGKLLTGGKAQETPPVTQPADGAKAADAGQKTNGAGGEEGGEEGGETAPLELKGKSKSGILALNAFTVNLNDPFGRRYVEVLINLEISNKEYVSKLSGNELIMPRIRDEIFMIMSAKSYNELKSTSGKVTLKEEIMMRLNELMKEEFDKELVSRVYFTKFIIQ